MDQKLRLELEYKARLMRNERKASTINKGWLCIPRTSAALENVLWDVIDGTIATSSSDFQVLICERGGVVYKVWREELDHQGNLLLLSLKRTNLFQL